MAETLGSRSDEPPVNDPVLDVRNVNVTFEMNRGRAHVLNDVSIEIERGETFGILGESGCGKSMFASVLLDAVDDPGLATGEILYYPEEGDPINLLELNSRELRRVRWEEIGMVFQGAMNAFNPTLNIRTHFKETFAAHNVDFDEGLERAKEILRDLNLNPKRVLDMYQHELSGGEKQRALLALSLVFDPEVLVLDEPTAALDLLMQRTLLSLLYDLKDKYDLTLVLISHDIPIVSGFADRLGIMYAFEFVERGGIKDVLHRPDHPYTRLLLQSTLDLSKSIGDVDTLDGETPDPINVPAGCPFHPRCPIADDRCAVEKPELRAEEGSDHEVACFYPEMAAEQIPISTDRNGMSNNE